MIVVAGHVGNNEAVGRRHRRRRLPGQRHRRRLLVSRAVRAARRQREAWGVRLIPWRNLRELYGVLRRRRDPRPARRLGLPRRRRPGPPVRRLDDAARRSRRRSPRRPARSSCRSRSGGRRRARSASRPRGVHGPVLLARRHPAGDPARSPTPSRRRSRAAPEQWYSFKPIWPDDRPSRRAARASRGRDAAGRRRDVAPASTPRPDGSAGDRMPRRGWPALAGAAPLLAWPARLGCPRRRSSPPPTRSASSGTASPRPARHRRARTCAASARGLPRPTADRPGPRAATDPAALERLVRACVPPRRPLLPRGGPGRRATTLDDGARADRPRHARRGPRRAPVSGGPVIFVGHALRRDRAAGHVRLGVVGHRSRRRWRPSTTRRSQPGSSRPAAGSGVQIVPIARRAAGAARRPSARRVRGHRRDRDLTGGGIEVPFFGAPAPIPAGPRPAASRPARRSTPRRPADCAAAGTRAASIPVPAPGRRHRARAR